MNVSLTPQLEEFIKRKVESGLYHTSSEVIREALRLLEEHDRFQEMKLETLRKEIKSGIDSLDRGEGIDGEEVFARLERRAKERK